MLSSFSVAVLLKLFSAWYALIDGLQQLSVCVVGVLPVLTGYAMCGTAMIGGVSGICFQTIPNAVVKLLCAMIGDNVFGTSFRRD
ncbi:hypothetical protein JIQ42_05015 [Leishmania sp. Namibia]|uniref:hypothetical protein n=1 Tax=Leishmania sp. Namibia TaxID=2802991 RepID=UPI001B6C5FA9|nr:hypothetical protein JIQ42_05015 [Leishmania sp. Namibia]